jgi:hypothetical protein
MFGQELGNLRGRKIGATRGFGPKAAAFKPTLPLPATDGDELLPLRLKAQETHPGTSSGGLMARRFRPLESPVCLRENGSRFRPFGKCS